MFPSAVFPSAPVPAARSLALSCNRAGSSRVASLGSARALRADAAGGRGMGARLAGWLAAGLMAMGLAMPVHAVQPEAAATQRGLPVSAAAAEQALARGAVAWDVRPASAYRAGHLPAAVQVAPALLWRWQAQGDLQALSRAVSEAGIDLSREVVLYGEPGDAQTQALYEQLQVLASGRVHWLVGGVTEWQLGGRALAHTAPASRAAVPQHLVAFRPLPGQAVHGAGADGSLAGAWARRTVTVGIQDAQAVRPAEGDASRDAAPALTVSHATHR